MAKNLSAESTGMSYTLKLLTSIIIYYCNFCLGLGSAFIPTSLLEFSKKFETDISSVSKVFAFLTLAFLLGAIVSGLLLNFINRQIASPLILMTLGIAGMVVPMSPSLPAFFGLAIIVGLMCAVFSTAQNVWILDLWESKAAIYIQVQHFSFALGTIFSPLVMKFYLPDDIPSYTNKSELLTNLVSNTPPYEFNDPQSFPNLYVPFVIGGSATVFGGILFVMLYFITYTSGQTEEKSKEAQKGSEPDPGVELGTASKNNKIMLVFLSAVVLGAYQGMEVCSFQFVPTFTHFIPLNLPPAEGSLVLSWLAVAFTLGRGFGILAILKIRPEILLFGNFLLVLIGNTLLLGSSGTSFPALCGGTILLGIGYSTIVPSFYGFIEKQFKVCNIVGSILNVACGLAPTIYPLIIGSFIEHHPFILMYTNYCSLILCATSFSIIYITTRQNPVKGQPLDKIGTTVVEKTGEPQLFDIANVENLRKSKEFEI